MKAVLFLVLGVAACGARTPIEDDPITEGGGGAASELCPSTCVGDPGFACVTACDRLGERVDASCVAGSWTCPPHEGRFPSSLCEQPHVGGECGGVEETPCSEGLYCTYSDYDDGTCGRSGQRGICVQLPPGCFDYWEPLCSCSGEMNSNVDCPPQGKPLTAGATYGVCDSGSFEPELGPRCGMWMSCSHESQFCVRRSTRVAGAFEYTCEGLSSDDCPGSSAGCPASCTTLADHECGADCAVIDGMVMLTCGCSPQP